MDVLQSVQSQNKNTWTHTHRNTLISVHIFGMITMMMMTSIQKPPTDVCLCACVCVHLAEAQVFFRILTWFNKNTWSDGDPIMKTPNQSRKKETKKIPLKYHLFWIIRSGERKKSRNPKQISNEILIRIAGSKGIERIYWISAQIFVLLCSGSFQFFFSRESFFEFVDLFVIKTF